MFFETSSIDSRRRSTFGHLALLVFVAGGIAAADAAFAQRNCLLPPAITGRICSEATCLSLQAAVGTTCKNPFEQVFSCKRLSDCEALREMRRRWVACGVARDTINAVCWSGGDLTHQDESRKAWQNVGTCNARIAEKCNDPCPQNPGSSLTTRANFTEASMGTSAAQTEEASIRAELILLFEKLAMEGDLEAFLVIGGEVEPSESGGQTTESDGREE